MAGRSVNAGTEVPKNASRSFTFCDSVLHAALQPKVRQKEVAAATLHVAETSSTACQSFLPQSRYPSSTPAKWPQNPSHMGFAVERATSPVVLHCCFSSSACVRYDDAHLVSVVYPFISCGASSDFTSVKLFLKDQIRSTLCSGSGLRLR